MKVFTSYIISERIARKLGECSYIENKEAARKGMHLAIFIYFLAANCWERVLMKIGVVN